jgi:fatty acid desaturase
VVRDLILHVTGLAAARQFLMLALRGGGRRPRGRPVLDRELAGVALTQALILAIFAVLAHWSLYLLLWVLPLVTVAKTLTHFRNVVEHARVRTPGGGEDAGRYRTILCTPVEAFFFAPMNFNYHAEHHFYMGVPWHRLPRCHAILSGRPEYRQHVEIERGYLRFLFRTLVTPPRPAP